MLLSRLLIGVANVDLDAGRDCRVCRDRDDSCRHQARL